MSPLEKQNVLLGHFGHKIHNCNTQRHVWWSIMFTLCIVYTSVYTSESGTIIPHNRPFPVKNTPTLSSINQVYLLYRTPKPPTFNPSTHSVT